MKSYPSISRSTGTAFREFDAYVFDKLDGSNLRFEWSKKQGWFKFGTRTRLFDLTDPIFGSAIPDFKMGIGQPIEKVIRDNKWQSCVVFCEFWGANSFAGLHEPNDKKHLTLFDVAPYKKGILGPKQYLDLFGDYFFVAPYHGKVKWTRQFVEDVYNGKYPCAFEGVVGKSGEGHNLIMAKAKTKQWIDKVIAMKTPEEAKLILES